MSKYAKGTQAMLDAAKNDATLLPFDTVFIFNKYKMIRTTGLCDNAEHIKMCVVDNENIWEYYKADDLLPAKKPKQKKWQNGTQQDLDNAKDDARLIPKKTYFLSKNWEMDGDRVHRVTWDGNDKDSVMMFSNFNHRCKLHSVKMLSPIKEE